MNTFYTPESWLENEINIIVVGAGGTGSALLTELSQINYMISTITEQQISLNIEVYDADIVTQSNIGRQAFHVSDLGMNKADVLVSRLNMYAGTNWTSIPHNFIPTDASVARTDLIITCVDKAKVRADIGRFFKEDVSSYCVRENLLWLDTGNDSSTSQVVLGRALDVKNKLPNVFDLYPQLENIEDIDEDSCSHVDALRKQSCGINKKTALEATGLIWKLLREGSISHHGSFIDLNCATVKPLKIDPINWAILGYKEQA